MKPSKTRYWAVVAAPLLLPAGAAMLVFNLSAIGARLAEEPVATVTGSDATDMRLVRSNLADRRPAAEGSPEKRGPDGDRRQRVAVRTDTLLHAVRVGRD